MTDTDSHLGKVVPIAGLQQMAKATASLYGEKGSLVIVAGENGVRIGVDGLTPIELREALTVAIHYSFVFEEESA